MGILTADDFSKHLNTEFTLHHDDREWRLMLKSISTLVGRSGNRQPFSVVFTGAPGVVFPQRIYSLEHDSMGRIAIFIVPIASDAEGTHYEAIFS